MHENFQRIWDDFPSAVTITDLDSKVIYMNKKSIQTFEKDGGANLIGKSIIDCHKPESNLIIERMLTTGESNTYTIEKNGLKKLIHQSPWFLDGKVGGLIELSIILPEKMEHFVRG